MQRSRRTNPYPFTWEIPIGIVLGVLLLILLGFHAGRAMANLTAGAGLTLTPRQTLLTSVPGLIAGDAGAGLEPRPAPVAGAGLLWLWTLLVQALNLVLIGWGSRIAWQRWGPGRVEGVATRTELDQLLGLGRLRKVAPVVRPDLYAKAGRR
ncbi:hypothetical protein IGS73_07450 [Janibacter indicus]|uniref:Conjugal transfer protein n=1 Tax=Janibacter indicus TaxID=857417 RepID=A0A7L9J5A5_9MICO|nr:hypothetical protein [Janibacter indicus]QOK24185.1 hypothetical protein IGS73_07450 [Janibacter indicus]